MFKKRRLLSQLGTTLIEILLATAILGLVMTGIVSIITLSVKNTAESKARSIAIKYAQEATEFFRQQKQILGWESFVGSFPNSGVATYCVATIPVDLANLQTGECSATQFVDAKGIFQRQAQVSVTQITRDGQPVTDVNVSMTVTWTDGNNNKQSTVFQKFEDAVVGYVPPTSFPQPSGTAWRYRKQIPIANTASAQTDFQVQLTLDTLSLSGAGKMLSNCNDIRITDTNGVLLSYWIEPGTCNTSASKVWVKVPSVPAGGTTVYFYYGKPTAPAGAVATTSIFIREIANVVAAWDMNEASWNNNCSTATALDTSGSNNHALSCPSTTGPVGGAAGKFNNGGSFDGSDDYLSTATNASYNVANITVSAWVYTTVNAIYHYALARDNTTTLRDWNLGIGSTLGAFRFSTFIGGVQKDALSATSFSLNAWHFLVGTYDGSNVKLYTDGALVATTPATGALGTLATDVLIGARPNESSRWSGFLDNLRIYSQALLQAEVTDLYGTGGDRQGYTTTNYPNKELVRKFSAAVTVGSVGAEEGGWYVL